MTHRKIPFACCQNSIWINYNILLMVHFGWFEWFWKHWNFPIFLKYKSNNGFSRIYIASIGINFDYNYIRIYIYLMHICFSICYGMPLNTLNYYIYGEPSGKSVWRMGELHDAHFTLYIYFSLECFQLFIDNNISLCLQAQWIRFGPANVWKKKGTCHN